MAAQKKISPRRNRRRVGERVEVLVEGLHADTDLLLRGRLATQAPDIDGGVIINDGDGRARHLRDLRDHRGAPLRPGGPDRRLTPPGTPSSCWVSSEILLVIKTLNSGVCNQSGLAPLFFLEFRRAGYVAAKGAESEIVTAIARRVAESRGFELVDVEVKRGRGGQLVRLFVDKQGGIGLDELQSVSEEVSAILDAEDPIDSTYTLEVSSPGLDRPLKQRGRLPALRRAAGQALELRARRRPAPLDGTAAVGRGRRRGAEPREGRRNAWPGSPSPRSPTAAWKWNFGEA